MIYKPGDSYYGMFITQSMFTGAAKNADSTPTAALYRNGIIDGGVSLTVTNIDTGLYKITGMIPGGYSAGNVIHVSVTAIVDTVVGKGVIDRLILDSKRNADLNDIAAGVIPTTGAIADAVWDEVISKATHNVAQSAAKRLRQVENVFIVHEGTARGDGGGNNTIQLAADASAENDWYKEAWVILVEGTGEGQIRHIGSYIGSSGIVTFGTDWITKPDDSTDYIIIARGDTNVHEIQSSGLAQINAEVVSGVASVKNILEGDVSIDVTTTPWQLVVKTKGTSTELIRKDLKDITGSSLASINTIIGQVEEP